MVHITYFCLNLLLVLSFCLVSVTRAEETTELPGIDTQAIELVENNLSNDYISESLLNKVYTYVQNSPTFRNYSKQGLLGLLNGLDEWEEPKHLVKNFPYYHAGYDAEDRPVWMAEMGKFNLRKEVEQGEKNLEVLLKYAFNACYRIIKSIHVKDTPKQEVRYAAFLFDLDGFDLYQFSHAPTMLFILKIFRDFKEVIREILGYSMLVNANHFAQLTVNLVRPILGPVLERVEVHGTNKAKWIPLVRRQFPEDVIPIWYGGSPKFKPVQVYG